LTPAGAAVSLGACGLLLLCNDRGKHPGEQGVAIDFKVNGRQVSVEAEADTPLLWVLREDLEMTGTKFGCGIAACGACSVHVDGQITRSCSVPIADIAGKSVTTIEGLKGADGTLHAVQQAWIDAQVPQCGYCQSGQIMAAVALIEQTGSPSDEQIDEAMTNICRCGTYPRIRKAILAATGKAAAASAPAAAPAMGEA
jgi:isoquinoline 1-oxidoreductase alpha subunit